MNKQRRKELAEIRRRLDAAYEAINELGLSEIKDDLEALKDEEEQYCENLPENMQNSERADNSRSAVDALDNAMTDLEEVLEAVSDGQFESITNSIEEAENC